MKLPGRIEKATLLESQKAAENVERPFLSLHRLRVVNNYKDGSSSPVYGYDAVLRKWLDAVVLLLIGEVNGEPSVCLRSCMRPPLLMRDGLPLPVPDEEPRHILLELPAGLIEDQDRGPGGLARRSAAEALEEAGYDIPPEEFEVLGIPVFLSPGVMAERIHFMTARVEDVKERARPEGDGSIAEEGGDILWVSLDEALSMCERGEIIDAKTELGLRRFVAQKPQGKR